MMTVSSDVDGHLGWGGHCIPPASWVGQGVVEYGIFSSPVQRLRCILVDYFYSFDLVRHIPFPA